MLKIKRNILVIEVHQKLRK